MRTVVCLSGSLVSAMRAGHTHGPGDREPIGQQSRDSKDEAGDHPPRDFACRESRLLAPEAGSMRQARGNGPERNELAVRKIAANLEQPFAEDRLGVAAIPE